MGPEPKGLQTMPLRPPSQVMRLERMGCFHQSRLSFMRILLRRLKSENWKFSRPVFSLDANGVGHAVYVAQGPARTYSLVAFAHDLPDELRSDRVIAEAWDATFTLFDGVPTPEDIERLGKNVPLQEAGRVSESELSLSRANRSVRLWSHVVERLSQGQQPDLSQIDSVGYLMRTTAVYGSGKFGAADREKTENRPECMAPFQIEMLSVFLTRAFVRDLVEYAAEQLAPDSAVKLDTSIAKKLGIGNSTGLGMAPFLINHPRLLNNWIFAREEAFAMVRAVQTPAPTEIGLFGHLFERAVQSVENWNSQHPLQIKKLAALNRDIAAVQYYLGGRDMTANFAWDTLWRWAESTLSNEGQEMMVSLMIEPYGHLVDQLSASMADNVSRISPIDGAMTIEQLSDLISAHYSWALEIDWDDHKSTSRAWYISEEKLEPRMGERFEEPIEPFEQPLSPARDIAALYRKLSTRDPDGTVADFVMSEPEYRNCVRRAQLVAQAPYAEIRDNTISAELLPIDMLRCKLSFFGAVHFDPRSDRWVRISMYQNAPYPEELQTSDADFWPYPELAKVGQ